MSKFEQLIDQIKDCHFISHYENFENELRVWTNLLTPDREKFKFSFHFDPFAKFPNSEIRMHDGGYCHRWLAERGRASQTPATEGPIIRKFSVAQVKPIDIFEFAYECIDCMHQIYHRQISPTNGNSL